MEHAVVRIFDVFEHAEEARAALLADGFDPAEISFSIANDEAGPVEGNFTVGNLPVESDRHTYDRNYAKPNQTAQCLFTVAASDAVQAGRADAILARFGARAIGDPASRRSGP